jgi:hypothetical protein
LRSGIRGLATLFRPFGPGGSFDGTAFLSEKTLSDATRLQADGYDAVLEIGSRSARNRLKAPVAGYGCGIR